MISLLCLVVLCTQNPMFIFSPEILGCGYHSVMYLKQLTVFCTFALLTAKC